MPDKYVHVKRTILITGASSGIGKSTAIYFAEKGWNVAATMRNPNSSDLMNTKGIKLYSLDVTRDDSVSAAIQKVLVDFGNIDVIVNNAGYGTVGPFEAADQEAIRRQYDTNVFGVMNVIREILPLFREKRGGIIINVTSMGGRITFPLYSLYHGTKWAVEGFSESLQYELNEFNIRVKLIEPGTIRTEFYDRSMDVMNKEGLHDYDNYFNRAFPNMQKRGLQAPGPLVVAKKIYTAATDGRKKMRYPAGGGAPLFLFLRTILPVRLFNFIVRKAVE